MSGILIIGAGGHAKVVADIVQLLRIPLQGFLDDNPDLWDSQLTGLPVLGGTDAFSRYKPDGLVHGIGENHIRRSIAERLASELWVSIVHPSATVATSVQIGSGTVVAGGAVINPHVYIGTHCIINTAATVDHDCQIGNYVHVAPGVNLAGGVTVGDATLIGIGASVIPYRSIGANVVIGAGAVVVDDIPDGVTAVGVPARWK